MTTSIESVSVEPACLTLTSDRIIHAFPRHDTVKLDNSNFFQCQQHIKLIIEGYELLGFLDGTLPFPPRFVQSTDDSLVLNPCASVYNQQDRLLASSSGVKVSRIRYKLHSIKKGNLLITEYVIRIQNVCALLDASSSQVLEVERVEVILASLPPKFDTGPSSMARVRLSSGVFGYSKVPSRFAVDEFAVAPQEHQGTTRVYIQSLSIGNAFGHAVCVGSYALNPYGPNVALGPDLLHGLNVTAEDKLTEFGPYVVGFGSGAGQPVVYGYYGSQFGPQVNHVSRGSSSNPGQFSKPFIRQYDHNVSRVGGCLEPRFFAPWRTKPRARMYIGSDPCIGLPRLLDLRSSNLSNSTGSNIHAT
ncbi:hypothetical protein Godav_001550 [Gossypium davidsonii]|uniref:Uncharacterized protein n=1 Tax=Gossypium davidsonii TaxID=34287 RepID=A0A7J8T4B5_GOSDV|nr:hypothetical protein [Gossypium davidsonii]